MRAVDLMPPEERGSRSRGGVETRTGAVPYVLVAVLAAIALGMTGLALAKKSVNDKQSEVVKLEQEEQAAVAKAEALRPFAEFRALQEARTATVASLAQSRFDWERVLRELSLVLPPDAWFVSVTGTVSPETQVEGGGAIASRTEIAGPALEIVGCATGQDAVAELMTALEDIDGVTRVGISSSELPEDSGSSTDAAGDDCRTEDFIVRYEIVVAFDEIPVPEVGTAPAVPGADPALAGNSAVAAATSPQVAEAQAAGTAVTGG